MFLLGYTPHRKLARLVAVVLHMRPCRSFCCFSGRVGSLSTVLYLPWPNCVCPVQQQK
jgi:hypothetical protein